MIKSGNSLDTVKQEIVAKKKRHDHDVRMFKKAKKFFDIRDELMKYECQYYMCFGMRSNGKTWSTLNMALQEYEKTGRTFCYIRRWSADLKLKNMQHLLDPQPIQKLFGATCQITAKKGAFVLQHLDDEGKIDAEDEIGYFRSISDVAHDKSIELPNLKYIIFDEFLPMQHELCRIDKKEVKSFINAVTTLTRVYSDIKVIMLGNTTTLASGYFNYFDIHVAKMKQGDLVRVDVPVRGGEGVCRVAVKYCEYMPEIAAITGIYAPKDGMITSGEWERAKIQEPPHIVGELNRDLLLCSLNDCITGRTVGLYVRTTTWQTFEPVQGLARTKDHCIQYLLIKLDSDIHDQWHCTNYKDNLTYGLWTNFDAMSKDIADQTGVDIYNEFMHNRVYAEDDLAADRFYAAFNDYRSKSIIDLLTGGKEYE